MRVFVDDRLCCCSGTCAELAPAVFQLPDSSPVAVVMVERVPPTHEGDVILAERSCPSAAIRTVREPD